LANWSMPAPSSDASACRRDLDNWPRSWMGLEKDLPPGEELVACLRPFIEHLAPSSLFPNNLSAESATYPRISQTRRTVGLHQTTGGRLSQ
jgi:hypothetical protein